MHAFLFVLIIELSYNRSKCMNDVDVDMYIVKKIRVGTGGFRLVDDIMYVICTILCNSIMWMRVDLFLLD